MIKYISYAEKTLTKLKKKKIKQIKKTKFNFSTADIAPILRGLLSEKNDDKFILNFKKNSKLDYFINGKDINRYSNEGTSTPDHVIRVKPFPLIISPKPNLSLIHI